MSDGIITQKDSADVPIRNQRKAGLKRTIIRLAGQVKYLTKALNTKKNQLEKSETRLAKQQANLKAERNASQQARAEASANTEYLNHKILELTKDLAQTKDEWAAMNQQLNSLDRTNAECEYMTIELRDQLKRTEREVELLKEIYRVDRIKAQTDISALENDAKAANDKIISLTEQLLEQGNKP
jgi:chromosome segregation ATPase